MAGGGGNRAQAESPRVLGAGGSSSNSSSGSPAEPHVGQATGASRGVSPAAVCHWCPRSHRKVSGMVGSSVATSCQLVTRSPPKGARHRSQGRVAGSPQAGSLWLRGPSAQGRPAVPEQVQFPQLGLQVGGRIV